MLVQLQVSSRQLQFNDLITLHSSKGTVGQGLDTYLYVKGQNSTHSYAVYTRSFALHFEVVWLENPAGATGDFSRMWDGSEALEISTE